MHGTPKATKSPTRFTLQSESAINCAKLAAHNLGPHPVSPINLYLALRQDTESMAEPCLNHLQTPAPPHQDDHNRANTAFDPQDTPAPASMDAGTRRIIERAFDLSVQDRQTYVSSLHILEAILDGAEDNLASFLAEHNINRDAIAGHQCSYTSNPRARPHHRQTRAPEPSRPQRPKRRTSRGASS